MRESVFFNPDASHTSSMSTSTTIPMDQQSQFQTKFGALAYEIPYRDKSSESSCACSYGLIHAKEPLEQYPKFHNKYQK